MPGPMDALRKAQTIGPDLQGEKMTGLEQEPVVEQGIPFFPPAKIAGLAGIALESVPASWGDSLKGLVGWGQKAVPEAAQAARGAFSRVGHAAQETLGEYLPDFTPVGGEEMLNVARRPIQAMADPAESAYQRIKTVQGMKSELSPMEQFYQANPPASFEPGGGRMTGQFSPTNLLTDEPEGLGPAFQALKRQMGR